MSLVRAVIKESKDKVDSRNTGTYLPDSMIEISEPLTETSQGNQ